MCSIKTILGEEKYKQIKNIIKLKYQRKWLMAIYKDSRLNTTVPLRKKIWAYRKGFVSRRIDQLGITDNNTNTFLSDYDYMKLYPINGRFGFWIDDKLTTKYILAKFSDCLPEYYFHLSKGYPNKVFKLMDCPEGSGSDVESVLKLLENKGHLALKPLSGAFGFGFIKLGFKSSRYMINDKETGEMEIRKFLMSKEDYIVTEYVEMHEELKKIYPHSLNTVRLIVINENGDDPFIGIAGIKFGTKRSGFVDNITSGGVNCQIDTQTGCYCGGFGVSEKKEFVDHIVHPDTGVKLEGAVPNWQIVKEGIQKICKYIPMIEFMGFDVAVTADGFKIIEINSAPGLNRSSDPWGEKLNSYFSRLLKRKGIRAKNGF